MRRRSRALLALVLPALVLRALIPFGFMPVAGNGGPVMELCPGVAAMAAGGHAHHHHGGGANGPGSAHALCVFTASAAPALAPVVPASPPAAIALAAAAAAAPTSISLPTILRAQAARAPPSQA